MELFAEYIPPQVSLSSFFSGRVFGLEMFLPVQSRKRWVCPQVRQKWVIRPQGVVCVNAAGCTEERRTEQEKTSHSGLEFQASALSIVLFFNYMQWKHLQEIYLHLWTVLAVSLRLFGVVLSKFLQLFLLFCVTIVPRNLNHFARRCSNMD